MSRTQVLINGAGPTGLVLALWLTKQGIAVRITDRIEATPFTSRAVVVHARTIELYRQLGLAQDVVADGEKAQATNMWTNGVFRVRVPLGDAGKGITPFPFFHIYPQYRHERFLERKLNEMGVYVERNKEMVDFTDHGDRVTARLKDPRKETSDPEILETIEAAYIAGCDGAHSAVRRACNIHFTGATYSQLFFVADIQAHGAMANGEPNITFNGSNIFLILPYQEAGHVRLNGAIHSENLSKPMSEITFEDVAHSTIGNMPITVDKVNWFSTYHVHHRVADSFRQGRAFLVGDAGHIHSPVGGQGMNTGTGDAINLAWKLAAVLRGRAAPAILDTYEQERRAFAQVLVETTDYAFNMLAKQSYLASFVRYWVIPYVLPWLVWINVFRHNAFKRVSQMALNYRQSALSAGVAGRVQGGDRLPWAVVGEKDNSDSLSEIEWQTHVYGNVQDGLKEWCGRNQVALHVFSWDEEYASVGLARDAAYLIRPDTYVAVAELSGLPDSFEKFFRDTGIHLK